MGVDAIISQFPALHVSQERDGALMSANRDRSRLTKLLRSFDATLGRTIPGYEEAKRRYWRPQRPAKGGPPRPLRPEVMELLPHLDDYKAMFEVFWLPYVMNCTYPNVRSKTVNTDGYGFRYTIGRDGERLSPEEPPPDEAVNLIVGASVAFGVGATSDARTLPSLLTAERGEPWFNMTMRGFTFAQNLVQALFFLPKIGTVRRIVLFGGINDINQYFLTPIFPRIYGNSFEWMHYFELLNTQFAKTGEDDYAIPDDFSRYFSRIKEPTADRAAFEESLRNTLSGFKLLADGAGARFYVALEPVLHSMDRALSPEESRLMALKGKGKTRFERRVGEAYRQWYAPFLQSACSELGIGFIDMNKSFGMQPSDSQWLFIDNVHLTDAGTREAAKLINQMIDAIEQPAKRAASARVDH